MKFRELFEGNTQILKNLRNTKGIRDEIAKLKKQSLKLDGRKLVDIMDNIKWLESKLKGKI